MAIIQDNTMKANFKKYQMELTGLIGLNRVNDCTSLADEEGTVIQFFWKMFVMDNYPSRGRLHPWHASQCL